MINWIIDDMDEFSLLSTETGWISSSLKPQPSKQWLVFVVWLVPPLLRHLITKTQVSSQVPPWIRKYSYHSENVRSWRLPLRNQRPRPAKSIIIQQKALEFAARCDLKMSLYIDASQLILMCLAIGEAPCIGITATKPTAINTDAVFLRKSINS